MIQGDDDRTVPIAVAGRAPAAAIPDATFIVYEGAAHAVPFTRADPPNADLPTFLPT